MSDKIPPCDRIASEFADELSFETKVALYRDMKSMYPDQALDIMEAGSIEDAIDDFAFKVAWHIQHRLLCAIGMDDDEIESRVYGKG